jgi:hypothetical protein
MALLLKKRVLIGGWGIRSPGTTAGETFAVWRDRGGGLR